MSADEEAQAVLDEARVAAALADADEVAAFYRRLRFHRVPAPAAFEFTTMRYFPDVMVEEVDDDG